MYIKCIFALVAFASAASAAASSSSSSSSSTPTSTSSKSSLANSTPTGKSTSESKLSNISAKSTPTIAKGFTIISASDKPITTTIEAFAHKVPAVTKTFPAVIIMKQEEKVKTYSQSTTTSVETTKIFTAITTRPATTHTFKASSKSHAKTTQTIAPGEKKVIHSGADTVALNAGLRVGSLAVAAAYLL